MIPLPVRGPEVRDVSKALGASTMTSGAARGGRATTKAAAEFGAVEAGIVAQQLEQWGVRISRHAMHRAVHLETDSHNRKAPPWGGERMLIQAWRESRPTGNETIS